MKKIKSLNLVLVILLITIFSLLFISCKQNPSTLKTYKPPEDINDRLEVGSLEEVNIDQVLIEKAITDIEKGKFGEVHSMLVYKDGKLVIEEYFDGHKYQWDSPNHHSELVNWNSSMPHVLQSVTKSITSTIIGLAIKNGFIQSVNQSIFNYLPEHQDLNTSGKDIITIEHLLTMTSGLEWNEWGIPLSSDSNDIIGIWFYGHNDPIRYILERPLINEPGLSFNYSGGNMFLLGEIITNATEMEIDEFSEMYLFEPLGIDSFDWWIRYENGFIETASGLKSTPRDMIKIGVTFLNGGVWDGKQIISDNWVEKSATPYPGPGNINIKIPGEDFGKVGYSYTWWTKEFLSSDKRINCFFALGWGGQKIMVFPGIDSVVVFTGGNFTTKVQNYRILEKYILPAIIKN